MNITAEQLKQILLDILKSLQDAEAAQPNSITPLAIDVIQFIANSETALALMALLLSKLPALP